MQSCGSQLSDHACMQSCGSPCRSVLLPELFPCRNKSVGALEPHLGGAAVCVPSHRTPSCHNPSHHILHHPISSHHILSHPPAHPHPIHTPSPPLVKVPDAVEVYRRVLHTALDHSVVIAAIGFVTSEPSGIQTPAPCSDCMSNFSYPWISCSKYAPLSRIRYQVT